MPVPGLWRRFVVGALFSVLLVSAVGHPPARAESGRPRGVEARFAVRGDRILVDEQADVLMTPASVTKLVLATTLLHHLGPEHRLRTRLWGGSRPVEGVLAGDLVVQPAGDPSWSWPDSEASPVEITRLARRLREAGIRRVAGDLVVDSARFPGRSLPPSRALSEAPFAYGAPTSGLAIGGNSVTVEIAPGARAGEPGKVRLLEPARGLRVESQIRTVGPERHEKGTVDFFPVWGTSRILARGEYPVSEPAYRIELSVPDPDLRAARALHEALRNAGVEIEGEARLGEGLPPTAVELAFLDSPPVAEMLRSVLTDSDNWTAEMLLRALAAELRGEGRSDTGLEIERRFLEEIVGLPAGSFELDDASGLSPYNLLTPRATVELLRFGWHQVWRESLRAALASPGRGTLAIWGALPELRAKTGTLRHTVALAGWIPPARPEGEPVFFAGFLNHRPGDRGDLRAELRRFVHSLH